MLVEKGKSFASTAPTLDKRVVCVMVSVTFYFCSIGRLAGFCFEGRTLFINVHSMSGQQQILQTFDPKNLQSLIAQETERRSTLRDFIAKHLIEGVDYGTIQIGGRSSKPCLFKPGAEKFCSLLQLRAEFVKDEETLSMMGETKDVIAYLCRLIHAPTGSVIAEGRGACALKEKQGSVNTTVKIAEKRAQIDAVLRLGFSESFTQDLEDTTITASTVTAAVSPVPSESREETEEKKMILKLLEDLGHSPARSSAATNKQKVKTLTQLEPTSENYEEIIDRLRLLLKEKELQRQ